MSDLKAEIEGAIADYHRVFPAPCALAPNLSLASRALAEVESLRAKLAAVEAIHMPKNGENAHGRYTMCVGCSTSTYPCPTIAAIRSQEPPTGDA